MPWPMKPGVCTPPPVMEAISEKVMPRGVMPACSRQVMTTPMVTGSTPQMHSKQPQEVMGSWNREYRVTCSRAPWEYLKTASSTSS